jgi:hypothetical protein
MDPGLIADYYRILDHHFGQYQALGHNEMIARKLAIAHAHLHMSNMKLKRFNQGHPLRREGDTVLILTGVPDMYLVARNNNSPMMQEWKDFVSEAASSANRNDISLKICLDGIFDQGGMALELLLAVVKPLHRPGIFFEKSISTNRALVAIKMMKINPTLAAIFIGDYDAETFLNDFKTKKQTCAFVDAVAKHKKVEHINVDACNLCRTKAVISAFVPILQHVKQVSLVGNDIRSCGGAMLIANSLARNPCVEYLDLRCNNLNDVDVSKLAASLKTNTTLRKLFLSGNKCVHDGVVSLIHAVNGSGGFEEQFHSNHICKIDVCDINALDDPRENWIIKMLLTVMCSLKNFGVLPTELVPQFLVLLQKGEEIDDPKLKPPKPLDAVYQYLLEWNEILLKDSGGEEMTLVRSQRFRD